MVPKGIDTTNYRKSSKGRYAMKKKGSFISSIIAILVLYGIISYFWDAIKMVLIIISGCILVFIFIKLYEASISIRNKPSYTQNTAPSTEEYISATKQVEQTQNETIKRQVEILTESIQLVNDSNNLDTVLKRYLIVYNTLNKLLLYSDAELREAGYALKKPVTDTQNYMQNNRVTIINQAIERNINHEIGLLKTTKGKVNKLDVLYQNIKNNKNLENDNLVFLENLYSDIKNSLDNEGNADKKTPENLNSGTCIVGKSVPSDLLNIINIYPGITDMLWIGDGEYKNYIPPEKKPIADNNTYLVFYDSVPEEPSTLYLGLPISEPIKNTIIESPPYYPVYKDLLPEQRWLYWNFLSNPFSKNHDIGYVFLFYYGLERHMVFGNFDKAFDITLKLRESYNNSSFQFYTATALVLACISKQRADLAVKLLESYNKNDDTNIRMDYLLILKYTFQLPLTISEIIRNYQYFGFNNNRYIKNQPEMFEKALAGLIQNEFEADIISLNQYFPIDISSLPATQERMFANISLSNYKTPLPAFKNTKLNRKISSLLNKAHETVKYQLREMRKQKAETDQPQKTTAKQKLSPIERENIPKEIKFDFSETEGWETWDNKHILETYYNLSDRIQSGKEVLPKIEACEKSYKILKPVISYFRKDTDGLPPVINCRDRGPSLYMRLGDWDNAEKAIKVCINTEAYNNAKDGMAALDYLETYKKAAQAAINFIIKNPGFLQKNIYIALTQEIGEENIPILKDFMRETYVFHKEPEKGSNRLYYIERK